MKRLSRKEGEEAAAAAYVGARVAVKAWLGELLGAKVPWVSNEALGVVSGDGGKRSRRRGAGRVKVTQAAALPLNSSTPAKHARRPDDKTMH